MKTYEDIVIAEIDGNKVLLDLVLPETDKPAPVILNIHGGGWIAGDHKGHRFCSSYIQRGWALADIGYRLSRMAPFPAQIEDCHTAVRFLRANADKYNLDPKRIGAFGFSAGGHLALLLGATADVKKFQTTGGWEGYSSRIQAVVSGNGPTDIPSIFTMNRVLDNTVQETMRSTNQFTEEQIQLVSSHGFGGNYQTYKWLLGNKDPKDAKELCQSASIMPYVSRDMPPVYIIQSDADDAVAASHGFKLYIAMKEVNADVELRIVPNANHGLCNDIDGNYDFTPIDRIFTFFAEKLKIENYGVYPPMTNNA